MNAEMIANVVDVELLYEGVKYTSQVSSVLHTPASYQLSLHLSIHLHLIPFHLFSIAPSPSTLSLLLSSPFHSHCAGVMG